MKKDWIGDYKLPLIDRIDRVEKDFKNFVWSWNEAKCKKYGVNMTIVKTGFISMVLGWFGLCYWDNIK